MRILSALLTLGLVAVPQLALAHGGGLDAKGCHNDRKNGGYHCHRAQVTPAPPEQALKGGGTTYYKNCSEARLAGAAPVRHGDPGYGKHLDRDGDGVACE